MDSRMYSPIIVHHNGFGDLPYTFNDGAKYAMSLNSNFPRYTEIRDVLCYGLKSEIIFEEFSGLFSDTIEIGTLIEEETARSVLKVLLKNGFWPNVNEIKAYRLLDDKKFGYGQRIYLASRDVSGDRIDSNKIEKLLS